MSARRNGNEQQGEAEEGISRITVSGFKSISKEQSIAVRPLTILAGANSSGKSSIMQPLLLMKQTLEATFDPGPVWLGGPNVSFTSVKQLLSMRANSFRIGLAASRENDVNLSFSYTKADGLRIQEASYTDGSRTYKLRPTMSNSEVIAEIPFAKDLIRFYTEDGETPSLRWSIVRDRCFLVPRLGDINDNPPAREVILSEDTLGKWLGYNPQRDVSQYIRYMIHVPGLRGNPERTYKVSAAGPSFPGLFQEYVASIIARWVTEKNGSLTKLAEHLELLGLTASVSANRINDAQVELQVGRLPRATREPDMVNIADVGLGVSQVLPVLVALLVAEPGQLVYIEQPELHLHPRAQWLLARVFADAAKRGVRVVVETHSSLFLLGVQTLVAQGELSPELVVLHWFRRGEAGQTSITSTSLDEAGAFGDWPQDFADVSLDANMEYLDAAQQKMLASV
jgi:predicted ATPase